jgi:predicted transcriptional regulator
MMSGEESLEDLKYLLGNMGIDILFAIEKGAKDFDTIKLFSGLPIACIKGRIPVLLDLKLIRENDEEYFLEEKGIDFKKKLESAL